jgi:succinoglycan biosynthesis transport protein ExoP
MDLQALLQVLWRKKWILIVVPIFAMGVAFAVRYFGEWKFVSTAQLATGLTVSDELLAEDRYLNPYEVQVTFNNLTEIIRSRAVIGQVSYRLMLHDLNDSSAAFRRPQKKAIRDNFGSIDNVNIGAFRNLLKQKIDSISLLNLNKPDQKQLQRFIDAYGYDYEGLTKDLSVNRVNQSDFIDVSYVSENPVLSAFIVNTLCSEFIRYYTSVKTNSSNVSLESLEAIARQRKDYLDQKMEELRKFKTANDLFNAEAESEAKIRQMKDYEDQIAEEGQKIRGLELTLANLNLRIEEAEMKAGLRPNDKIIALRKNIAAVNERYIQSGQKDAALLDSLTSMRVQLDAAIQKTNESGPKLTPAELQVLRNKREESRVELEIARENLSSLNNIYSSLRFNIRDAASNEAVGSRLEKEVEVASEEHLSAQNRLSDAKGKTMTNKVAISQVLIADPAEKAQSRKTLIFMILAGFLSFSISAFTIVAIEVLDTRIKTPTRLKQKTRLKLAGTLPKLASTEQDWNDIFRTNGHHVKTHEDIRKIRFEIENYKARVMMVTSVKDGAGKSFFIVALAYSLSLLKKRTLIIDTNLRNNSLTRTLLAHPSLKMLVEDFAKKAKLLGAGSDYNPENNGHDSDTGNLITKTTNQLIDIIGNKKTQLSPSEVIPGGDFKVLIEWLKSHYDYILLEGPALNTFSDSKELVRFVDLVVPIFSAESSIDAKDNEALNYLKSLQDKLGPAILNNVEERQ